MTVQTTESVATAFGNGVTVNFEVGFKFNADEDLVVIKVDPVTGEVFPQTLDSDYTVTGAGAAGGGSITFDAAPASGVVVKITRLVDLLQLTDLRNQGKYFAEVHENVFDLLVMMIQQVSGISETALQLDALGTRWDANGNRIINVGDPTADQDAATLSWVQQYIGSLLSAITGNPNNAANVFYLGVDGTPKVVQDMSEPDGAGMIGYDELQTFPEGSAGRELQLSQKLLASSSRRIKNKAIVSFIFDDAYASAYTQVKPLFEAKGFRAGFAVNAKWPALGAAGGTNSEQLLVMQAAGHEIINHGATHAPLGAGTENTYLAQSEIEEALYDLRRQGFDVQTYVAANSTTADVHIDKYLRNTHSSGYTVYNNLTGVPALQVANLDPFKLHRLNLFEAGLVGAKATVDAAIANEGWVCFYDHDPSQVDYPNSMSIADLTNLLDYCIAQDVAVMLPRDAIDRLHSSTVRGRRIELMGEMAACDYQTNLLVGAELNSLSSSSLADWVLTNNGATGTGVPTAKLGGGAYHYRRILFSGNTADVGSYVLANTKSRFDATEARGGRQTFSMDLFSSSAGVNTNFDVSLGIQVRKVSDNSAIAGAETGKLYLDQYARRYYTSIAIERPGEAVYYQVFIRVTPKVSAAAANVSFGNPSLTQGRFPAFWSPGQPTLASVPARLTFQAASVSSARVKIPVDAPSSAVPYLSVSGGTVTIVEAGLYAIRARYRVNSATDLAGSRGIMSLRVNGGADELQEETTGGPVKAASYRLIIANNSHRYFNEGDTLEFWGFSEVTSSFPADATYNYALITKVG